MEKVKTFIPQVYKALMPLLLGGVMMAIEAVGLRPGMTLEEATGYVLASALVYFKRNY